MLRLSTGDAARECQGFRPGGRLSACADDVSSGRSVSGTDIFCGGVRVLRYRQLVDRCCKGSMLGIGIFIGVMLLYFESTAV